MKKKDIVKNNKDFDKIIKKGLFCKNKFFVIYYSDNNTSSCRFGISVSKKIGNAVIRNYYKRVIRNICDINKKYYSKGKDYIIIMRNGCVDASFKDMNDSMIHLFNIIKEKGNEKKD